MKNQGRNIISRKIKDQKQKLEELLKVSSGDYSYKTINHDMKTDQKTERKTSEKFSATFTNVYAGNKIYAQNIGPSSYRI